MSSKAYQAFKKIVLDHYSGLHPGSVLELGAGGHCWI